MSLQDPADDAIGPENVRVGVWQQRLVLFQRIAGGFMIFKGLVQWGALSERASWREGEMGGLSGAQILDAVAKGSVWINLRKTSSQ